MHIAFLTGYRNRVGAGLTWPFTFTRDSRRERTFTTRQIGSLRDLYAAPGSPDHRSGPSWSRVGDEGGGSAAGQTRPSGPALRRGDRRYLRPRGPVGRRPGGRQRIGLARALV